MQPSDFEGDKQCLKWNFKNLRVLEEVVKLYVSNRGTVVQAGGNLGVFPRWLSDRFDRVITFEPDVDNFLMMCRNAPAENIIRLQAALGCEHEGVGMSKENEAGRTHAGVVHVSGPGIIPTLCLDDFELDDVAFIQLDVEGYEIEALTGAMDTINRCQPVIMAEINRNATMRGWDVATVEDLLGEDYTLTAKYGADKVFLPCRT